MRGGGPYRPSGGPVEAVHLLAGPALFLILLAWPSSSFPYQVRGSLGLLLWMGWWWIFGPVHLAVTGFLPLVVVSLFGFVPVGRLLPAYASELVILLMGASILAAVWSRWGLDRRIALHALLSVGTGARRQILAWFLVAAAMSMVLPNTVVAAALMPVVVAMLKFVGIRDLAGSVFGTGLGLAVAWGSSVGGMATPLGGA
ncbi:MAG: SLC13 family permease, partial [Acidobacteriota bacterium]